MLSGLDKLPADLKEYVKEDNQLFEKELVEWDMLQARKAQQEKLPATAATSSCQPVSTEAPQESTGQS